jgi:hypothetical protein
MAWYWWVVLGILGLNALVIALVALFLAVDRIRSKRARTGSDSDARRGGGAGQGG